MALIDELITDWENRTASLRCNEVVAGLESLEFVVKTAKSPGHKLYTHPRLRGFLGSSFNCGHGKNEQIKKDYIRKILRILRENRDEILEFQQVLNRDRT